MSYVFIDGEGTPVSVHASLKSASAALAKAGMDGHVEDKNGVRVLGCGSGYLGILNALNTQQLNAAADRMIEEDCA